MNEIIKSTNSLSIEEIERTGSLMAKSGFFSDSAQMAQAAVKILAGQEIGVGAFAAMTGIYVISGRLSIGANVMASRVKASGKYDYKAKFVDCETFSDKSTCHITFYQGGQEIGVSTFSISDAKKAGTKNIDKFPRNMLFARAMSNGVRFYCPDIFTGVSVYTPEELGADVDESGNVITVMAQPVQERSADIFSFDPTPEVVPAPSERPYAPELFKERFLQVVRGIGGKGNVTVSDTERNIVASAINGVVGEAGRYVISAWLTGKQSTKEMGPHYIKAFLKVLDVRSYDQPPSEVSMIELRDVLGYLEAETVGTIDAVDGEDGN